MKPRNLISVYEGAAAIEKLECDIDKRFKSLKCHEIRNLGSFLKIMMNNGCDIAQFDGYFVGYTIAQISKEFDLLRFGTDYILDIEIKSELKVANKLQKIHKQMKENYYYLKFLGKPIKIFTYVENDGFYEYDKAIEQAIEVEATVVADSIIDCKVDETIDPTKAFVPSNYLISPFNSTDNRICTILNDTYKINYIPFDTLNDNDKNIKDLIIIMNTAKNAVLKISTMCEINGSSLLPTKSFEAFSTKVKNSIENVEIFNSDGVDINAGCGQFYNESIT